MKIITSAFVAFGLVASLAVAGDGEGCPSQCKASEGKTTALAAARKAIADLPKADEKLPAEQLKEVKAAREYLMQTPFGKAMGPSFETCGHLAIAAAKQEGTAPEAAALLKDMAATYCTVAKIFGGCAECGDCGDCSKECCEGCCKDMTPAQIATKANESLESSKKLLAAAMEEAKKAKPEDMQKMMAAAETLQKSSPCWTAIEGATKALNDGYASLAKMGIPASEGATARDGLVKGAFELHGMLTGCHSGEECQPCEEKECGDAEKTEEEVAAPGKSS
jgi:hypothetical protein